MTEPAKRVYGEAVHWKPERPRYSAPRVLLSWLAAAATLMFATWIVPGAHVDGFGSALIAALVIAILNALLPPLIAALRLPFMLLVGFGLVLVLDALMLMAADSITEGDLSVDSFWSALLVALVASAVGVGLDVLLGTADDETYTFRVMQRIARRSGERIRSDAPGIVFLEIDGLALPVLRRAMRDGSAPTMAGWLESGTHRLTEWETDLSSQTGASQAGIFRRRDRDQPDSDHRGDPDLFSSRARVNGPAFLVGWIGGLAALSAAVYAIASAANAATTMAASDSSPG